MDLPNPNEENRNLDNKCFSMECGTMPYSISQRMGELDIGMNFDFEELNSFDYGVEYTPNFENPTKDKPISIAKFLGKYLDLTEFLPIFESTYGNLKPYHYKKSLEGLIKASMVRRIKCIRSFQKLHNRFAVQKEDAEAIGFQDLPKPQTFQHFENTRIDNETLEFTMDSFVISLREKLALQGEILGKRVGIDSTPLEALFNDDEAKYNGHYEISGYKIHGVYDLDRNIPLAIIVTTAEVHDSPVLKRLLTKIHELGIKFEEVYADAAYNGFENFALIHVKYNAKFYAQLDKDVVFREDGTHLRIKRAYQKFWQEKDFLPDDKTNLEDMMKFLMKHNKFEPVGAYFRNIHMKEWEKWNLMKEEFIPYDLRNIVEGFHGFVKKYLNLQKYFDYRGFKNAERHIRWTYLAVLGIALTRIQNGITENLTQIAYFE